MIQKKIMFKKSSMCCVSCVLTDPAVKSHVFTSNSTNNNNHQWTQFFIVTVKYQRNFLILVVCYNFFSAIQIILYCRACAFMWWKSVCSRIEKRIPKFTQRKKSFCCVFYLLLSKLIATSNFCDCNYFHLNVVLLLWLPLVLLLFTKTVQFCDYSQYSRACGSNANKYFLSKQKTAINWMQPKAIY